MKWWKGMILGVLALGVVAITVAGLKDRPPPAVDVQTAKARKGAISRVVVGAGKVESVTTVKISSNLSGDLLQLFVKDGDPVKKGMVLAKIDARPFLGRAKQNLAAANAAKSDIANAQVDVDRYTLELKRTKTLAERGMSSGAELDLANSNFAGAMARLSSARERYTSSVAMYEQAQTDVSRTELVAPIDGNVIELSREIGERVRGSDFSEDTVMTIAALNNMQVKIEVGEHEVVFLKTGQRAELSVDALEGQTFEGSVVEIAQKATIKNPGTESEVTTFPVKVLLDKPPGWRLARNVVGGPHHRRGREATPSSSPSRRSPSDRRRRFRTSKREARRTPRSPPSAPGRRWPRSSSSSTRTTRPTPAASAPASPRTRTWKFSKGSRTARRWSKGPSAPSPRS